MRLNWTTFLTILFLPLVSFAKFNPPQRVVQPDWSIVVRQLGIGLSSSQYATLHQFEVQGNTERNSLTVDLVRLARNYPGQAQQWIKSAAIILDDSAKAAQNNESFRRTRTDFLRATLNAMSAEGTHPKIFTASWVVSTFWKYRGSAKFFYNMTSVIWAYSDIVAEGRIPPGKAAMSEAIIQNNLDIYKEKMDVSELPVENEATIRAEFERRHRDLQARRLASLQSRN